jgi:hypothetical protein
MDVVIDFNFQQSYHLKLLKIKNTYIRKVTMHFTNKFSIWWCFILFYLFSHYFDIFLESTFFIFLVH